MFIALARIITWSPTVLQPTCIIFLILKIFRQYIVNKEWVGRSTGEWTAANHILR